MGRRTWGYVRAIRRTLSRLVALFARGPSPGVPRSLLPFGHKGTADVRSLGKVCAEAAQANLGSEASHYVRPVRTRPSNAQRAARLPPPPPSGGRRAARAPPAHAPRAARAPSAVRA